PRRVSGRQPHRLPDEAGPVGTARGDAPARLLPHRPGASRHRGGHDHQFPHPDHRPEEVAQRMTTSTPVLRLIEDGQPGRVLPQWTKIQIGTATTEEFSPHDQLRREPPNRAARSSENTAGTPWTLSTVTSSVTATTGRFYLGSTSSSTEELGQDPIWNETNDALDAFCSSLPHPGSSRLASRLIPSATTKRGDHLRHLDAGADHGWKTPGSPASAARRHRTVRELLRICRATG